MINISAHIIAQLPYEATEGNGDNRNLLNNFDVPFVPEEFKSSPKRIVFDKNDLFPLSHHDKSQEMHGFFSYHICTTYYLLSYYLLSAIL